MSLGSGDRHLGRRAEKSAATGSAQGFAACFEGDWSRGLTESCYRAARLGFTRRATPRLANLSKTNTCAARNHDHFFDAPFYAHSATLATD